MKVILVMFKDDEQRDFPLAKEETILGRRQDCDLRIPTKDVSRRHCSLTASGRTLTVKDLGSSNGTYVNSKRIAESPLEAGDCLRIGPVTFVVQIDGRPADIQPTDASEQSSTEPSLAADEEATFDLSDSDFDLEDPISALEEAEDEDDMP